MRPSCRPRSLKKYHGFHLYSANSCRSSFISHSSQVPVLDIEAPSLAHERDQDAASDGTSLTSIGAHDSWRYASGRASNAILDGQTKLTNLVGKINCECWLRRLSRRA